MNFSEFELSQYDEEHYNCMHFAADLYKHVNGLDIHEPVKGLCTSKEKRQVDIKMIRQFTKLPTPLNACIVRMKPTHGEPHAGFFYNNRVMHLTKHGAQSVPLYIIASQYKTIHFYHHNSLI